jgi:hypothetical protein
MPWATFSLTLTNLNFHLTLGILQNFAQENSQVKIGSTSTYLIHLKI